jgi:hypothetical protein
VAQLQLPFHPSLPQNGVYLYVVLAAFTLVGCAAVVALGINVVWPVTGIGMGAVALCCCPVLCLYPSPVTMVATLPVCVVLHPCWLVVSSPCESCGSLHGGADALCVSPNMQAL